MIKTFAVGILVGMTVITFINAGLSAYKTHLYAGNGAIVHADWCGCGYCEEGD